MVDVVEGQDANAQSGPSEETKAEQRRTAKERRGRIEANKAALEASEVRAKLDSTERLLKEVIGHQTAGDDDKVQGAIREHEQREVSIKSQVEYKKQMDDILLQANLEYDDEEVFDALDKTKGGSGMYNAIRLWENEWANEMGLSDIELAVIPVEERARRICAKFLRSWFEFLELEKMRREREKA